MSGDVHGPGVAPVYDDIEIVRMVDGSELDATVHFDVRRASEHARYAPCAAVGMEKVDGAGRHKISFELLDPEASATARVLEALDALDARVDSALLDMARQDEMPRSMC